MGSSHSHGGHGHSHGHSHGHGLQRGAGPLAPPASAEETVLARRRLKITLILTAVYMLVEAVGGYFTHSLALMADAAHMFSDVAALSLSLFVLWLSARPASARLTFGFHRAEILAALINASALVAVSVSIFAEAYERFQKPEPVQGFGMIGIATGGLLMNLIGLYTLGKSKDHSLNVRGAWLHLAGDTLGSLGALVAGILIALFGWVWVDPLVSLLIGLMVIYSSWGLLRDSVSILMESVPEHLDVEEVRHALEAVPGVMEVHDLHIWTLSSRHHALVGHVVVARQEEALTLLKVLKVLLKERFYLEHVTLQLEPECYDEEPCTLLAPPSGAP